MDFLKELGLEGVLKGTYAGEWIGGDNRDKLVSYNPTTGEAIGTVLQTNEEDYELVVKRAQEAWKKWRMTPAPIRGLVIRDLADELRKHKEALGRLVSLEMGKILQEGLGEVQEMIDICDFAVGLSRQLYGKTMPSERPEHRIMEQWHPLGVIGIVTAFNFPVAVWSWNAAIAAVCGDVMIWKPSSKTPLCAIAVQNIVNKVAKKHNCEGVFNLIIGRGSTVGERMLQDKRIPLISFTGSVAMGKHVAETVGRRLGRTILELGGNNAVVVMEDADIDMAINSIFFGAIGTSGQRCTSTRRVIVHESVKDEVVKKLVEKYNKIKIGDPLDEKTTMGPLVDEQAIIAYERAIEEVKKEGGKIIYEGGRIEGMKGYFVKPTIAEVKNEFKIVQEETFAPLLYIITFKDIDEAIEIHNNVPQGLSSSIFTQNFHYAEKFISPEGSDCGMANINLGTSGAEIGGAFGGEKETGGGRESGSDSWKLYMRRLTSAINYGKGFILAQGIKFGDDE